MSQRLIDLPLTGGPFDPLGLASGEKADRLKEAEIKHARLAMIAFLGELVGRFVIVILLFQNETDSV